MAAPSAPQAATKNPTEWATGKEPMTGRQRWYLKNLSEKLGTTFKDNLTKAEASAEIDQLRARAEQSKS